MVELKEKDGVLYVHLDGAVRPLFNAHIAIPPDLDLPQGFKGGAVDMCMQHIPAIPNITLKFREELASFAHKDTPTMLKVFDFTRTYLLASDADNSGILFITMRCFGSWWAGVASQLFAATLIKHFGGDVLKAIQVVGLICKTIGACATFPTIPLVPNSGEPVDPVILLVDLITGSNNGNVLPRMREGMIGAFHDWQIPKYLRGDVPEKYKGKLYPFTGYEKSRLFLDFYIAPHY